MNRARLNLNCRLRPGVESELLLCDAVWVRGPNLVSCATWGLMGVLAPSSGAFGLVQNRDVTYQASHMGSGLMMFGKLRHSSAPSKPAGGATL